MTTTLDHIDALRDMFTDLTQDCLLLDLTPITVRVQRNDIDRFDAWVQFAGTDIASANTLADSWGLEPGRVIGGGTYLRSGTFDLNGRSVQMSVFTGHPGAPALPAGYAPQAVEV